MGWQPDTQPKGKPPVEKTKGAETMQRLIDADALIEAMTKFSNATGEDMTHGIFYAHIAPTIDAVPLDGSFLKMSRGDYLIYKRHWLYEHFDQEIDIQRSAMKSMGYEPALKDAEPQWIPVSERLPDRIGRYLVYSTTIPMWEHFILNYDPEYKQWFWDGFRSEDCDINVLAWMPLPKHYEVEND